LSPYSGEGSVKSVGDTRGTRILRAFLQRDRHFAAEGKGVNGLLPARGRGTLSKRGENRSRKNGRSEEKKNDKKIAASAADEGGASLDRGGGKLYLGKGGKCMGFQKNAK